MAAIRNTKQLTDTVCTAPPSTSAIGLIRFSTLSASAKLIVTFDGNVAPRLSRSNTATPACPTYCGASGSSHTRMPTTSAVTDNRFAARTPNCTAMITVDLSISTGSTGPAR